MEKTVNTKFYTFNQNNSGGFFKTSEKEGIGEIVIVEALNPSHANQRAEEIGLYFNGCSTGSDCSCCGDRWSSIWDSDEGDEVPSWYGEPIENAEQTWCRKNYFIHYLDKTIQKGELK